MEFSKVYPVLWHDTDPNRVIRPARLLSYMQETANAHLASAGLSLDELRDRRGLAYILSSISACIYEKLYAGDRIEVQTWMSEGHGLRHNRCYRVLRGKETVAEAVSVWALIDLREKRLLKNEESPYPIEAYAAPKLPIPLRIHLPLTEEMPVVGTRTVSYSDIDYNGHMNNTRYPDLLCDFTPDILSRRITGFALSFLHEATFGHELRIHRAEENGNFLFRALDADGTHCLDAVLYTEEDRTVQPQGK